jgi:hypothetical protein
MRLARPSAFGEGLKNVVDKLTKPAGQGGTTRIGQSHGAAVGL